MGHTTMNRQLKIDHIVITTSDVKACIAFYEVLGFQAKEANNRYELFQNDFKINVHLVGKELKPNAHLAKPGTLDICFEIEEQLEVWQALLREKAIPVSEILQKQGVRGAMRSFYLRDPDQNLIELCEYE